MSCYLFTRLWFHCFHYYSYSIVLWGFFQSPREPGLYCHFFGREVVSPLPCLCLFPPESLQQFHMIGAGKGASHTAVGCAAEKPSSAFLKKSGCALFKSGSNLPCSAWHLPSSVLWLSLVSALFLATYPVTLSPLTLASFRCIISQYMKAVQFLWAQLYQYSDFKDFSPLNLLLDKCNHFDFLFSSKVNRLNLY